MKENAHHEETNVRYYQFHSDHPPSESQDVLQAAESEMADDDEQDMETAVHALAERTEAIFIDKEEIQEIPLVPALSVSKAEKDTSLSNLSSPKTVQSSQPYKESSMTYDAKYSVKNDPNDAPLKSKNFGDLSSWEQVLEDRESTLAAREKVLRLRQKDLQDEEERFHEERKAFNADYEEKKAFLEDKEQRMKKLFERIEEVAYEFRRNTRVEGETS
jgi:hypothetical protein